MLEALRTWLLLRQLRADVHHSPESLELLQDKLLRAAVANAHENVPFYRRFWDEAGFDARRFRGIQDLERIPIAASSMIKEAAQQGDLLAKGVDTARCTYLDSSGSSGQSTRIWKQPLEERLRRAVGLRIWFEHGFRWRYMTAQFQILPGPSHFLQHLGISRKIWLSTDLPIEKQPQTLWRAHSDAVNVALLARWLPAGRLNRVLKTDLFDESVSDGLYSFLASRANKVVGMDVSIVTVRAAKLRCTRLKAAGADARFLPFVDGAFDVIVSNSTLDHFETPDEIIAGLRELRRVLQDGGQLIITLDNLANPIIALRNALPFRLLHRLGIVPYYVGPTFGAGCLKSALEELQFEIVEITSVIHFPRVIAVALTSILERSAPARYQKIFLRFLLAFERLSKWPTQFFTGHFVAAKAVKRSGQTVK